VIDRKRAAHATERFGYCDWAHHRLVFGHYYDRSLKEKKIEGEDVTV